jgi:hypothetical protein
MLKEFDRCAKWGESWIESKGLQKHHIGHEVSMLCFLLDKMIQSSSSFINTESCEIIARRIYGLMRAFTEVSSTSDWQQPKGNAGQKWKSKVRWDLCREIDVYSLSADGLILQNVEKELASRLKEKALINRAMGPSSAVEEEAV